jgi:hypothetical protein
VPSFPSFPGVPARHIKIIYVMTRNNKLLLFSASKWLPGGPGNPGWPSLPFWPSSPSFPSFPSCPAGPFKNRRKGFPQFVMANNIWSVKLESYYTYRSCNSWLSILSIFSVLSSGSRRTFFKNN